MEVKFSRVTEGYKNGEHGLPEVNTIDNGILQTGENIDTDTGYTIIINIGNVYLRIQSSEWGSVKVVSKEEADKILENALTNIY